VPTLVVPGVRVETLFDVLPPPLAPSGILGVAGVVDRPPPSGLVSIGTVADMRSLLGPGTEIAMPEVVHALRNGASEVVISAVGGGSPASATLLNADSSPVVGVRSRINRDWAGTLQVDVRQVTDAAGKVTRVSLLITRDHVLVEEFDNLVVKPDDPNDLFATVNGGSRYLVAVDPTFGGEVPVANTYAFAAPGTPITVPDATGRAMLRLSPAPRVSPQGLAVIIGAPAADGTITVQVVQNGVQETFTGLVMDPDSAGYLPAVLATSSRLVQAVPLSSQTDPAKALPVPPTASNGVLTGGASPSVQNYLDALDLLTDDTRIDTLLATVEPGRSDDDVHQIHQTLAAQAAAMADAGAPGIAYGSITLAEDAAGPNRIAAIRAHSDAVHSRRFVLVSPPGAAGAIAGLIARSDPQESPTFKPVPLFEVAPATYRETELNVLLGPTVNLCVAEDRVGHGVVVLRGLDTSGDQISVTRVADEAIRETKAICENFIGVLNDANARTALRQQLVATFTRMAAAGALVPSTDNTSPPFVVSVYSTQTDFDQGIVRVDIAVRPVRSIDYVYATIEVQG
jgi:hypothetical protein